jgi:transposase
MNDDPAPHSKRSGLRAARNTRRKKQLALREAVFDMIAAGYGYEVIAANLEISVATVRREFDRAIAERRLDAPERYARVQVARLNKALRVVDELLDKGDSKAAAPLIRLVAALDRYHGLAPARPSHETPPPLALPAPAPPLALTHAAPPIAGEFADAGQTADLVDDPAQNSGEPV